MRRADFVRLSGATVLASVLAGCAAPREAAEITLPIERIMVPAAPGGGYDVTARTAARIIREIGVLDAPIEVFNTPGGGGVLGLTRLLAKAGNPRLVLAMGLGIVGAALVTAPHLDVADATPLVRLATEPGVLLVPTDSPFSSAEALFERWRAEPAAVRVGGGSTVGGPDYLFALGVARALGLARESMRFVPYSGGGDVLSGLLADGVDVGFAGTGEMRPYLDSGAVRALAVSSQTPIAGINAPTLHDLGMPVSFENWRGIIGPPDMPEADRDRWLLMLRSLHESPEWNTELRDHGWEDAYLEGDAFREFISEQRTRVADILGDAVAE